MFKRIGLVLLIGVVLLAACGGGGGAPAPAEAPAGNAENGKTVFNGAGACSGCHSVEPGQVLVGPSLAGVGADGAAELHESIVEPDAKITEGFTAGVMPKDYGEKLSDEQLNDLVAYLLTLK